MHYKYLLCLLYLSFAVSSNLSLTNKNFSRVVSVSTQQSTQPISPASLRSPEALCGKGRYLFFLGSKPVGSETFEVKCMPGGGYSGTGHTKLEVPGTQNDLLTSFDFDRELNPIKSTVKGKGGGSDIDQSVIFTNQTATITNNGKQDQIPFTKGSGILPRNVFYVLPFIAAHYDTSAQSKESEQYEVAIFPSSSFAIKRGKRISAPRPTDSLLPIPQATYFDRYDVTVASENLVLWVNEKGRIVMISSPTQTFLAVREEYLAYARGLQTISTAALRRSYDTRYAAAPEAPFTSEEIVVEINDFKLAGTLLLPKSGARPFPVVITITGSGQQTRDEPLPIPGLEEYKPFRQIAEKIASEGIAVLRVDDRGAGASTGGETLSMATTSSFANDVRAEIAFLRKRPEIDPSRIALIGHSEGGSIALMVAATDPRISAIVLMATTAKRGSEVLAYQNKEVIEVEPGITVEEKARKLDEVNNMLNILTSGGDTSKIPLAMRSPWIKEFVNYDPLPTIRQVKQPILIFQGSLDHQITSEQAPLLAETARTAGNKDVELHLFPDLNHLFLKAKTGTFSEYQHLETSTVPDDVLNLMVEWLKKRLVKAGV